MEYLEAQMNHRLALAYWWMNAASNGHAGTRKMYDSKGQLDEKALRDDAMETAMRHLKLYSESAEYLAKLKEGE